MTDQEELELLRLRKQKALATANATKAAGPHGASGDWGYPDPGLGTSLLAKLVQGATKDSSDEGIGLAARTLGVGAQPTPGQYLRMPDGSEAPMQTPGDVQRGARDYVRQIQEGADQHHHGLGMAAQMLGEGVSDYAIAGKKMLAPGYQTLAGMYRGLMGNKTADLTRPWTPTALADAGMSTAVGGALGYGASQLPGALKAASETRLAQALAGYGGKALDASGNAFQNLGGWLKINSLHPTPTLSRALEDLPGGATAAGRELLAQKVGGLTKTGTAKQAQAAFGRAAAAIDELAQYHDAAGGSPIDITGAIAAGKARAQQLLDEPTTEAVGKQMMGLVEKYESKFSNGTGTAQEILGMKRALGKAAYGESQKLERAGDTIAGQLGDGLSSFERATDDALDKTLGPRFEAANLLSRQMRGTTQAAERAADRTQGNQLIGLKPWLAALAAGGGGHLGHIGTPEAAAAAAGTFLLGKYGSQMGARGAYTLGSGLRFLPRAASALAPYLSGSLEYAPAASSPLSSRIGQSLADMIEQARQPRLSPMFASGGDR